MNKTITHNNTLKAVYVTDDQTGETDDIYVFDFLSNVEFYCPEWADIPNLVKAKTYYDDFVKGDL